MFWVEVIIDKGFINVLNIILKQTLNTMLIITNIGFFIILIKLILIIKKRKKQRNTNNNPIKIP